MLREHRSHLPPGAARFARELRQHHLPVALVALVGLAACRSPKREAIDIGPDRNAPGVEDRPELCLDVGDARACWGDGLTGQGCAGGACVVARPVPSGPTPAMGWRCFGSGADRKCRGRARGAAPFECRDATCVQHRPRLPDDGEWECTEIDGVLYCHGGGAAAGVVAGPPDVGWICGPRRKSPGERVCVDLAPDRPDGAFTAWRCSFEHEGGEKQTCTRTSACGISAACACGCPEGTTCAGGRCLPGRPSPECWFDTDCDGARCRFGTCEKRPS